VERAVSGQGSLALTAEEILEAGDLEVKCRGGIWTSRWLGQQWHQRDPSPNASLWKSSLASKSGLVASKSKNVCDMPLTIIFIRIWKITECLPPAARSTAAVAVVSVVLSQSSPQNSAALSDACRDSFPLPRYWEMYACGVLAGSC